MADESHGGFWTDAWSQLRTRPRFIVAAVLITLVLLVAAFPALFTGIDPHYADPGQSLLGPSARHWFGTDLQGHDVYARTVYGARASVAVGLGAMVAAVLVGGTLGALAGFYGGWLDAVVSRFADIFFGVPLLLAAIVLMQVMHHRTIWTVIAILAVFGWPQVARIARGSVIAVRASDYVLAAKAMGLSRFRILVRHVVPNAIGPVIVVATIALGDVHRDRGDVVVPGCGPAVLRGLVGRGHQHRAEQVAVRVAGAVLPGDGPRADGVGVHVDG